MTKLDDPSYKRVIVSDEVAMTNTATIKGTVRQEVKERRAEIAREQGRPTDDELVAEAVETYVAAYDRDAKLIQEALDEARVGGPFVDGEEMETWSKSLATDNPLPRPGATIFTRPGE